MNKTWVFIIFFMGYQSLLYAAFDVKIGVYSNTKNLHHNISQLENSIYKNKIVVMKKGTLYYAHAVFPTKSEANKALKLYKRVFKDAFVAKKEITNNEQKKKKVVAKKKKPSPTVKKTKLEKPKQAIVEKAAINKETRKPLKKDIVPKVKPLESIEKIKPKKQVAVKANKIVTSIPKIKQVPEVIKEKNVVKTVIKKKSTSLDDVLSKATTINKKMARKSVKTTDTVAGKLFLNKTFYACSTYRKDAEVVKVHFTSLYLLYDYTHNSGHKVNYNFHKKSIEMDLMAMKVVHTYMKKELNYLVLDVTINDILVDKLRYYYDKSKAMKYLKSRSKLR